jgi:hypothetical protein
LPSILDLTGRKFGKLTVVRYADGTSPRKWLCVCDCGSERIIYAGALNAGLRNSCGDCLTNEMKGMRFGRLVALEKLKGVSPARWKCVCDCGKTKDISQGSLREGYTKSCGCIREEFRATFFKENKFVFAGDDSPSRKKSIKKHGFVTLSKGDPWVYRAYTVFDRCKKKKIEFGFNSAAELAVYLKSIAPTHCPVFGFEMKNETGAGFNPTSPSIDRIDPSKGYVRGNIQIISMKANEMKQDASRDDLIMFANWVLSTENTS